MTTPCRPEPSATIRSIPRDVGRRHDRGARPRRTCGDPAQHRGSDRSGRAHRAGAADHRFAREQPDRSGRGDGGFDPRRHSRATSFPTKCGCNSRCGPTRRKSGRARWPRSAASPTARPSPRGRIAPTTRSRCRIAMNAAGLQRPAAHAASRGRAENRVWATKRRRDAAQDDVGGFRGIRGLAGVPIGAAAHRRGRSGEAGHRAQDRHCSTCSTLSRSGRRNASRHSKAPSARKSQRCSSCFKRNSSIEWRISRPTKWRFS